MFGTIEKNDVQRKNIADMVDMIKFKGSKMPRTQ